VPFEGRGGLTVLAYPRLFLLLGIFITCVFGLWRTAATVERSDMPPARELASRDHVAP